MKLAEKLYENEQLFEQINTRLISKTEQILPTDIPQDLLMELYCECGDEDCHERIALTLEQFRKSTLISSGLWSGRNIIFPGLSGS